MTKGFGVKCLSISEMLIYLSVSWGTGDDGVRNEVLECQRNRKTPVRELADRSGWGALNGADFAFTGKLSIFESLIQTIQR